VTVPYVTFKEREVLRRAENRGLVTVKRHAGLAASEFFVCHPASIHEKEYWRYDGERLHLYNHPGQAQAWGTRERIILLLAGTQSGKSTMGMPWLLREVIEGGPGDYLAAAPSFPLLEAKLIPEGKALLVDSLRMFTYNESKATFTSTRAGSMRMFGVKSKARVALRHATNSNALEAMTAKAALLDEAGQKEFKVTSFEAIRRRLSIAEGRMLIPTTPYDQSHWTKTRVYDKKDESDEVAVIQWESTANPHFSLREFEAAQRSMPKWRFDMMYRAQFTRPAGSIYDCWGDGNLRAPVAVPKDWPMVVGVDFGPINTAMVFVVMNPRNGQAYVWRTYHQSGPVHEHCAAALEILKGFDLSKVIFVGGAPSEDKMRDQWADNGIPVMAPMDADLWGGIDRVYAQLKTRKLKVFSSCTALIKQIADYTRELDLSGDPIPGKIANKATFHLLDALRYAGIELMGLMQEAGIDFGRLLKVESRQAA